MPNLIPTAEPFLFKGNDTGVLLVHGFTGAPKEMRWMGEFLASQGYTVMGIRLAGHATVPSDLPRMHWCDWLSSVEDGYHMLSTCSSQVFIAGLSMGGILTLLAGSYLPVAGLIAMSTPYQLPDDPRRPLLRWLSILQLTVAKGPPDWHDQEAASTHVDYPAYPTRGIVELEKMLSAMRSALPLIKAPVQLIHSRQDTGVVPENMSKIYEHLGSSDKQMAWVEDSGHVITRDIKRQEVFQISSAFISRVSGKKL